jgi:hypothetical protein
MDNFNTVLPSGDKLKEMFATPRLSTDQIKYPASHFRMELTRNQNGPLQKSN